MAFSSQPLWVVVLSLGVTGSIVGAVIAAIAGALNDRSRRRFDLKKWRAEFYLRPKLEALRTLHTAMVRCHYEINMRAKARMPKDSTEYRENVERWEMEFFYAFTTAELYLDEKTDENMRVVLGAVRQMTSSIWLRLPENAEQGKCADAAIREPEWQPFTNSYDAAHARLKAILQPNELMQWIEK